MHRFCWIAATAAWGACSFSGAQVAGDGDGDGDGDGPDAAAEADAGVRPDAGLSASLIIGRTQSPPAITTAGFDLAEWSAVPRHAISFSSGHKHVDAGYSEDASAVFGAVHDATHIYFIVEVTDDEKFDADRIEIYFDTGGDMAGVYGADDSFVSIDSTASWSGHGTQVALEGALDSGENGDVVYALRVEKATLGSGVDVGMIGLNVSIWDADNAAGDGGWVMWQEPAGPHCASCCTAAPHGEPWCDTTMLEKAMLVP